MTAAGSTARTPSVGRGMSNTTAERVREAVESFRVDSEASTIEANDVDWLISRVVAAIVPLERELAEALEECERLREKLSKAKRLKATSGLFGIWRDRALEAEARAEAWAECERYRDGIRRLAHGDQSGRAFANELLARHARHAAAPQPTTEGAAPQPHAVRIGHRSDCPHFPHLSLLGKTCTCDYAAVVRLVEAVGQVLPILTFRSEGQVKALYDAYAALREGGE